MSYFDYEFIPLPLSPAAETEPVVSTASETEPVVSTATGTEPVASTATPDQPSSQPIQQESTESEPNNSPGAKTPTQPSAKETRAQERKKNLGEKKQERSRGEKRPLRSQGKNMQEQSPGEVKQEQVPGEMGQQVVKRRRRKRCGECPGCQRLHDCGGCNPCKHKRKFGGNGSWNRVCKFRFCEKLRYNAVNSSTIVSTSGTGPGELATVLAGLPTHRTKRGRKDATGRPPSKLRCGTCVGCLRNAKMEDCRQCVACKGKKKYGGSGRSHRICLFRECERMKYRLRMNKRSSDAANIPEGSGDGPVKKERLDLGTGTVPEGGEDLVRLDMDSNDRTGSDPHPPQSTPGDIAGPTEDEIDSKPTLLEMLKFPGKNGEINIPRTIGTNYLTFGIFLLSDEDGTKVDAVAEKHGALGILKSWVQGEGQKPVTWRTLVKVLKDSGFTALAEEIEDIKSSFIYVHVV